MKHQMRLTLPLLAASIVGASRAPNYVGALASNLSPTRELVYKKIADRELDLHIFNPEG